ncbi:MAG: enoyl-CoA hydratase/isomerase family protein, partial [Desulfosarcina sp.]|nr:enoyl-CoA hydratase/isomerase family protein [Desulfobacterales bacterium]
FETIVLAKEGHLATLTLNRPDKSNAINRKMMEELVEAIENVAKDDEVRALVLTGAGKHFCAGADFDIMPGGGDAAKLKELGVEALRRSFLFKAAKKIILGLQQMEKPTIAMINGACVGAGFDLALACDLKIASENAKFMCGFVKLGLFPGFGAAWLYPRAMGLSKALEMLFTGDMLTAVEANEIGMINTISSPEALNEVTVAIAQKIVNGPPVAIRLMKMQVYNGLLTDLNTALDEAAVCESITLASNDHREGVAAFREKRAPLFEGK